MFNPFKTGDRESLYLIKMKIKDKKATQMLENKSKMIMEEQLNELIFGPGIHTYNRFSRFLEVKHLVHGWQYWQLLRTAYENSDGLFIHRQEIKDAFLKDEPEKDYLMKPEEHRFLASQGPTILIHRGMSSNEAESGDFGLSWSLSGRIADFFAFEYGRAPFPPEQMTLMSMEILTKDVIAYFSGSEEEIIYIQNPQER